MGHSAPSNFIGHGDARWSVHSAPWRLARWLRGGRQGPPAIVLARGFTGLGTLRALADAGIRAHVACPEGELLAHSRWFRPAPGAPWDGAPATAASALQAMPLERAVLIAGADDAAQWLAGIPGSELSERFAVSSSAADTVALLQDKARFGACLASLGVPHPRTFPIHSPDDLAGIPFEELERVFLKPVDSQAFSRALGVKGMWARGRDECEALWHPMSAHGFRFVVQEYVPGRASDHYFIDGFRDRHGNVPGLFARRRERIFPLDFGNSSYCRSIPLEDVEDALEALIKLLTALNYRGIFSAEFKRDSRDGVYRLLEVNTRAWWYVEFAARCGVNVCRMAYDDALDLPVMPSSRGYRVDAGCVNLIADAHAVLARPPARWTERMSVLWQWVQAHHHVFRWDDPVPGCVAAWQMLRRSG